MSWQVSRTVEVPPQGSYGFSAEASFTDGERSHIEEMLGFVDQVLQPEYSKRDKPCALTRAKQGGPLILADSSSTCDPSICETSPSSELVDELVKTHFSSSQNLVKLCGKDGLNVRMLRVITTRTRTLSDRASAVFPHGSTCTAIWWLQVLTEAIEASVLEKGHRGEGVYGCVFNDRTPKQTYMLMATLLRLAVYSTSSTTLDSTTLLAYVEACRVAVAYRYNDTQHTMARKFFISQEPVSQNDAIKTLSAVLKPQGMGDTNLPPVAREHIFVRLVHTIMSVVCQLEFNSHLLQERQILDELGISRFPAECTGSDIFHNCTCCTRVTKELKLSKIYYLQKKANARTDKRAKPSGICPQQVEAILYTPEVAQQISSEVTFVDMNSLTAIRSNTTAQQPLCLPNEIPTSDPTDDRACKRRRTDQVPAPSSTPEASQQMACEIDMSDEAIAAFLAESSEDPLPILLPEREVFQATAEPLTILPERDAPQSINMTSNSLVLNLELLQGVIGEGTDYFNIDSHDSYVY